MKKVINRWLWAVVAVLTVGLMACSKTDEPEAPTVDPGTEQEDPNADPDEPGTALEDPVEPVEDWGDEKPHGFYFDIDSISMHLNEDGFLQFANHGVYQDFIVIEKKYGYPSKDRSKGYIFDGVVNSTSMCLIGKRATPWTNVDKYIELCLSIGMRANSEFSNFPELVDLPVRELAKYGILTLETLVDVDVISHKYFNKDIPAGGSMRGNYDSEDLMHPVGMIYGILDNDFFLSVIRSGSTSFGHSPEKFYVLGRGEKKLVDPVIDLLLQGYPEEAGDYPMTLRMEFANGTVLTKDFKIRFVNEQ